MPTAAAMYLAITDGTTTCTIADGTISGAGVPGSTPYPLVRDQWAPNVANIKHGLLGGDKYTNVVEELTIHIKAATEALLFSSLQTLNSLLEQATRWAKGEKDVAPVLLHYVPKGSTIHSIIEPLQAMILGVEPGNQTAATGLPTTFNSTDMYFYILNVRIRFKRKGLWLGATEFASAGGVANPAVLTVTMPTSPIVPGTLQVDFTAFTTSAATGNIEVPNGYVIICANPTTAIDRQQAEAPASASLGTSVTATSTADAAARASGGSMYRLDYVGSSIGQETQLRYTLPAAMQNAKRIGVFLTYRNNSASDYTIRAQAWKVVGRFSLIPSTPYAAIEAVANNPTPLFLGILASNYGFDTVQIAIARGNTAAGAQTLDIDTVVFVDMSSSYCYVVSFDTDTTALALGATYASKTVLFTIKNDPLTQKVAELYAESLAPSLKLDGAYFGDLGMQAKGNTIYALWLCTHLYNGATPYWTTQNNAGSAILSVGVTITRRLGYVTPQ